MQKAFFTILICGLTFIGFTQENNDSLDGNWILGIKGEHFTYSAPAERFAYGIGAECFLGEKISVRGGITVSDNYYKITTAPLGILLLTKVKASENASAKSVLTAAVFLVFLMVNSDGIVWNIPITKRFFFTPYIAPIQTVIIPSGPESGHPLKIFSSAGAGFNWITKSKMTFCTSIEYYQTFMLMDSKGGYRVNASIGYRIK